MRGAHAWAPEGRDVTPARETGLPAAGHGEQEQGPRCDRAEPWLRFWGQERRLGLKERLVEESPVTAWDMLIHPRHISDVF